MEMLPERKKKFPATLEYPSGTAADSLYHRPPGTVKYRKPDKVFTELMFQEAVIPPARIAPNA
jgi:hypothetical protein